MKNILEIKAKPNQNVVDQIKMLLAQAETGEIQSIVYCCDRNDRSVDWGVIGGMNKFETAGHLLHIANKTLDAESLD